MRIGKSLELKLRGNFEGNLNPIWASLGGGNVDPREDGGLSASTSEHFAHIFERLFGSWWDGGSRGSIQGRSLK